MATMPAFVPEDDETSSPSPRPNPRELQILALFAAGLHNDEIASALFLAPDTIKQHSKNARRKLNARSTTAAVAACYEHDLFEASPAEVAARVARCGMFDGDLLQEVQLLAAKLRRTPLYYEVDRAARL
jgi:DNA-binding CsgD family transcriptional regulator